MYTIFNQVWTRTPYFYFFNASRSNITILNAENHLRNNGVDEPNTGNKHEYTNELVGVLLELEVYWRRVHDTTHKGT